MVAAFLFLRNKDIAAETEFEYPIGNKEYSQRYAGNLQNAEDLAATDFMRGRDAGFQPYNQYRKFCGLKFAKPWEDFHDTIEKDQIESLRRIYNDVNDVELLVAIYIEKWLQGIYVGPSLYCIMVHNLLLWRKSDKFFFEHGDFPAALTISQLNEVRKMSLSRLLCNNGDDVKQIQPHSVFRITHENHPVPCEKIPKVNLNEWKDESCQN